MWINIGIVVYCLSMKKVFVAMSGGVDSSVVAALLKKGGFNVVGVFMKPWQSEGTKCLWREDREDALRVAAKLEIPLLTWDFSKEYKKSVTDYMIREYKNGGTPNPDVMCNKEIKFGLFLKRALKEGADYIATGHYVRKTQVENRKLKVESWRLLRARDKNKDQSYFLWTLTQKELKHCLFPIGDYLKPKVRKLAKKFGLPTADKKDSQGVCFIGPLDMHSFLKDYIKPKPGKIMTKNKKIIGTHDGVYYYTIGQRHGLDIRTGKGPYFVVSKDIKNNIIYVGEEKDLLQKDIGVKNISWLADKPSFPLKLSVVVRYRSKPENTMLYKNGVLKFSKPVKALTPGQSAVFYRKNEMMGGGIIK